MLIAQGLRFQYTSEVKFQFPDIRCDLGDTLIISGESGSGKTTLMHLLGGLLHPLSGSVRLKDTEISQLKGAELDKYRGKNISIIFQKMHFVASLSVKENLLLAQCLGTGLKDEDAISNMLERLHILDQRNKSIHQLSQGQQQRVAIARALINQPSMILADEPTSSLDNKNAEIVEQLLRESASTMHAALVIVTHDLRLKNSAKNLIELA